MKKDAAEIHYLRNKTVPTEGPLDGTIR